MSAASTAANRLSTRPPVTRSSASPIKRAAYRTTRDTGLPACTAGIYGPAMSGSVEVGIRIVAFEACSGFTHVTARRIAQPPKAAFVTRLQPCRLPGRTARQLPDQSTTLWVESSSTSDPRLRGALPDSDMPEASCNKRRPPEGRLSIQTRWLWIRRPSIPALISDDTPDRDNPDNIPPGPGSSG